MTWLPLAGRCIIRLTTNWARAVVPTTYPGLADVVQRGSMDAGQPWTHENHKSHEHSQAWNKKLLCEVLYKKKNEEHHNGELRKGQEKKLTTLCSCGGCMDKTRD